jgi:thiamine-phosphate pyrophosphorylase
VTTKKDGENFSPKLYRLIDANLNRLREGIRVVEDIQRYIFDNKEFSKKLKNLRHKARVKDEKSYLTHRDIIGDVLKQTTSSEKSRDDITSIMIANIKRAEESSRVLEESLKLIDTKEAENFKQIRYELYDIEKSL